MKILQGPWVAQAAVSERWPKKVEKSRKKTLENYLKKVGQKQKNREKTPGTVGGPGGRDRTLAVKSRKNVRK